MSIEFFEMLINEIYKKSEHYKNLPDELKCENIFKDESKMVGETDG